jgi:HK97 gp10 family phage protein
MKVEGVEQLNKNLALLADKYGKSVADALLVSGEVVRGDAIKSIQTRSGGETVTRYRAGGGQYIHVAAAPNTPPNTDTGALARSIVTEVQQGDVYVGSGLEYAPHLEFGTSKMIQRPFLNPALEKNRRRIGKLISDAIKKTTNRGVK